MGLAIVSIVLLTTYAAMFVASHVRRVHGSAARYGAVCATALAVLGLSQSGGFTFPNLTMTETETFTASPRVDALGLPVIAMPALASDRILASASVPLEPEQTPVYLSIPSDGRTFSLNSQQWLLALTERYTDDRNSLFVFFSGNMPDYAEAAEWSEHVLTSDANAIVLTDPEGQSQMATNNLSSTVADRVKSW